MTQTLSQRALALIRTRRDLHRWSAANDHGRQMHAAVDLLDDAVGVEDPEVVFAATQRAIGAAVKVMAHADDSSGVIGDACRRLLELHPRAAAAANASPDRLVEWLIEFQFHGEVDYFDVDPVAYAPALGDLGVARYRRRLAEIETTMGPPADDEVERQAWERRFTDPEGWDQSISDRVARWVLEHNARRLAVLDRDAAAIIATHLRDGSVAAWYQATAEAFEEIGRSDRAIEWAHRGTTLNLGHQSVAAARYWSDLLAKHQPERALAARREIFDRWPTAANAAALRTAAGDQWPRHRDEVMATLTAQSGGREVVAFALRGIGDVELAWTLAHDLDLADSDLWASLADAYEPIDPGAVVPVHSRIVLDELASADAANYRGAAKRLAHMRALSRATDHASEVDELVAGLRHEHRRRPRLQREFDRAGLP